MTGPAKAPVDLAVGSGMRGLVVVVAGGEVYLEDVCGGCRKR